MTNYHQTAHEIAAEARMIRATEHNRAILIVEGNTDAQVYGRFVNGGKCELIPAASKFKAVAASKLLENGGLDGILTIVDADFQRLDGIEPDGSNLLLTDSHDLETMILCSDALDDVLSKFGSARKITELGRPLRGVLIECGLPIGYLRWLSSPTKDDLSLKFKKLSFDKFVDGGAMSVNIDNLIRELKINSKDSTLDENTTKLKVMVLMGEGHDPWQVCSGHDLVLILSIGLRNIFGNPRQGKTANPTRVSKELGLAYNYSHFCLTMLHNSIKGWEKANPPFRVLHRISK